MLHFAHLPRILLLVLEFFGFIAVSLDETTNNIRLWAQQSQKLHDGLAATTQATQQIGLFRATKHEY